MKVVSEICTIALLESLQLRLDHSVKMLEISVKAKDGNEWDLIIAKGNLETVERIINFVRISSFNSSDLYSQKDIA